ncbi:MAG: alpha/beta fold hydrolase [Chloroflexi bacterium]|nr:MAG: alpha/beta fold hydrolase [Chloroflexota bacterium]
MKKLSLVLVIIVLLIGGTLVTAQNNLPTPDTVRLAASDELMLVGDYWAARGRDDAPAVILLHMLGRQRQDWEPLVPSLLDAGYHVLSIDLRGHGETGGQQDWPLALDDVQLWFDWLREQPGVRADAVSTIGASIGANVALLACADDADCLTAIALSPGTDYRGVRPVEAITGGLSNRSALFLVSQGDGFSADSVRQFIADASGDVGARFYTGGAHGTALLGSRLDSVSASIIQWIDEHTPVA